MVADEKQDVEIMYSYYCFYYMTVESDKIKK